jgi:ribonuclease R
LVSGRLDLHRDGFGFVRPEAGGERPGEDIFIPPNEINGAMQGDLVLVDEAPPGRDGRRSGRIARVLTRRNPTVVGIFHYAGQGRKRSDPAFGLDSPRGNYVTPLDERIGGPIEIPEGADILAAPAESPHRMLGEEARGQKAQWEERDARWPLEGLAVDVEIRSFPQPGRHARGRLIEVLGPPDAFGVDVEIVIRKHHIPHTFPTGVLTEAATQAAVTVDSLPEQDLALREDFRGLPIVTIDGETARDFDDAVLVRPLPNGNTELQVHIADVSWYVRPGSALDTEARVRGTSVYFPDRAVPMLPHALSSGMCSLRPNEERLVLSCIMEVDPQGEIAGFRVAEGIIRSVRRMTYTSVQQCLNASPARERWNGMQVAGEDGDKPAGKKHRRGAASVTPDPEAEDVAERERIALEQPELPAAMDAMLELALRLNAKRVRRGSIDFDLPEPVVEFDPDGNMKAIVRSERGWSHRLIEEFMLSANECVATWLERQGIPSIYRIHEVPDPKRIVEFEETAAAFGQSLGIGSLPVRKLTLKSDRRETRRQSARGRDTHGAQQHEIPQSIPVTPQMYQRLVRKIAGKPEERILAYLMLRSLKQARYAEKNEGHFALASPSYTHFTSPIRRYPDLIVHRLVRAMLRRGADPRGGALHSEDAQPWKEETGNRHKESGNRKPAKPARAGRIGWSSEFSESSEITETPEVHVPLDVHSSPVMDAGEHSSEPMPAEELNDIAVESSQAERRAADAERELIEWKKMKFMADKIGDDFHGIILSVTKYGFFVELDDMFIEGLVPIASLVGDHYSFRDTDRTICGARTGHCFTIGERVEVILDRIDRQQRRLQFALLPGTEPQANTGAGHASVRTAKSESKKAKAADKKSGKGKKKKR